MSNYVHSAAQGDALLYRAVYANGNNSVPYSTPGAASRRAGKGGHVEVCNPTWRPLDAPAVEQSSLPDSITIRIETHGERRVTFKRDEYEEAKAAGRLDHLIDPYASDMDEETTIVEPDGTEFDPYA